MKTNKKGFTLLELMMVVTIVGTLAAIALPAYIRSVDTALGKQAYDSLQMIYAAQLRYMSEYNVGPTTNPAILDVNFPGATATSGKIDFGKYSVTLGATSGQASMDGYRLLITYATEKKECISTNSKGVRVCRALGGTMTSTNNYLLP